ncbi:MAG: EF-P lysine aminoacylase GenX [Alphaproteobacteria bacterium]|nr:EF-P lysine aminoacylase GenX [Alphaproteobacteria bacterium]
MTDPAAKPGPAPWWRPDRFARKLDNLRTRQRVLRATRGFFENEGFDEVETPVLQVSPGLEPHLMAFQTVLRDPGERLTRRLYLHTSPEFAMKKLLAAGMPKIWQLAHCFRNSERSATHHPEFAMLEWYRANADYTALMADCEGLLRAAASAAGIAKFQRGANASDPFAPFEKLSVAEAFARYCGLDLLAASPDPERPGDEINALDRLAAAARPLNMVPHAGDRWDDFFFRLFFEHIEGKLGMVRPTILYDWPIAMAALSRAKPGDPRVAERFELYVCGVELANAFGELTDAAEQRRRFEADQELKAKLYRERYPVDEDFIAALMHGLPQSAGIALGFDRLVMLATGASHIEDTIWAPVALAGFDDPGAR